MRAEIPLARRKSRVKRARREFAVCFAILVMVWHYHYLFHRRFGFEDFTFNLSTKDPDKFIGGDDIWEHATDALREALDHHGLEYGIKEGDAAFYGPKIDIDVHDAIGRSWQLSTIQADFNLPERFDLEYV